MPALERTVLVCGASSGIGRAAARELLRQGQRVIGVSREPQCFRQAHPLFSGIGADFSRPHEIPAFAARLQQNFPELNAVVFAAGYGQFGGLEQFSYRQIEELITVNFTAQAFLTRALLPQLKKQPHANLIYIGSEAALKGSRQGTIYCASKFALRGFAQALRDECGKSTVRVSIINPGMVDTEFFANLSFRPGGGPGQALAAEDVAQAVAYILQAGPHCVIDEINLNPANKVVEFKKDSGHV